MNGRPDACADCRRRAWLLGELSPVLDYRRGDPGRLFDLLALDDTTLIAAIAGRRRQELMARHAAWSEASMRTPKGAANAANKRICRHAAAAPAGMREPGAPHMLHLGASQQRFIELASEPCAAILGGTRASDYGREMAHNLARGLSVAGVTVVSAFRSGIADAAHEGAIEAGGRALAVLDGALTQHPPGALTALRLTVERKGCLVSELPEGCSGRSWGAWAADRTTIALADAAILIEDEPQGRTSYAFRLARARGIPVGALPGPVTSRLSAGPHEGILTGAQLVRSTEDVLGLLTLGSGEPRSIDGQIEDRPSMQAGLNGGLNPALRAVLDRVGAGADTPEALVRHLHGGAGDPPEDGPVDIGETLAALAELELLGLVLRTAAGRYVARDSAGR